ncbi:glycosyl hydrolase [Paenibacillus thalictri]|uniref:Beta-mannanase n=1 Tax=Paenibacillus thalictri TaxID=2527873 RepID=A0A4Q9DEI6_9BACL|nr:glycosyl hydrolase [Paenibacillus thalictri]TBL69297.1 beta-mannanase [Paenibacillus thalictri]
MRIATIPSIGIIMVAALLTLLILHGRVAAYEGDAVAAQPPSAYLLMEAEDAELDGTAVADDTAGYSGSGYVTGFEQAGSSVHFHIQVDKEGFYPLYIGYASVFGDKTNFVEVNGSTAGEKMFPYSPTFQEIGFGDVQLDEGENQISLSTYWGYFDVDYIKLGPRKERSPVQPVKPKLVTPQPSKQAQALMNYMADRYGKNMLAGQQWASSEEMDYIYSVSGKLPAIAGFTASDFGDNARNWASWGGIVAVEWHWEAPMGGREFFAAKTSFDASRAVVAGTEENRLLLEDLDRMADILKTFRDAGIPVLWRPLHEAEGGWFWWGAKGPNVAKQLYAIMFDRFTRQHRLNNLIWVWTTSDTLYSKDWYPGDDSVDIIGVDRYVKAGDYSPLLSVYDSLVDMVGGRKLVAYLENGPIPDPRELRKNKVGWLYFNTWNGKFIMDGLINSEHHVRTVYNHPYVVTLDKFPSESIYGKPPLPYPYPARKQPAGAAETGHN